MTGTPPDPPPGPGATQVPDPGATLLPQPPPSGPPRGPGAVPPSGPPPGPGGAPPPTGPPRGPGAGPPSGPPVTPARAAGGPWWHNRNLQSLAAAGVAVVLLIAMALASVAAGNGKNSSSQANPGEIFLQPAASTGTNPFTGSVAASPSPAPPPSPSPSPSPAATATPTATAGTPAPAPAVTAVTGTQPGLYGGTRQVRSCNQQLLAAFLTANPGKARAWAAVEGIEVSQIPDYIASLTPVILRRDTRVTNHGYNNGVANAYQSVLEAGTAVLVDRYGVPRARCYCGNPLLPPVAVPVTPTYVGPPWPQFQPKTVIVVTPAPAPATVIVLTDPATGQQFPQPVGDVTGDYTLNFSNPVPNGQARNDLTGEVHIFTQSDCQADIDSINDTTMVHVTLSGTAITFATTGATLTGTYDPADGSFSVTSQNIPLSGSGAPAPVSPSAGPTATAGATASPSAAGSASIGAGATAPSTATGTPEATRQVVLSGKFDSTGAITGSYRSKVQGSDPGGNGQPPTTADGGCTDDMTGKRT